jgi:hypothetical protein
MHRIALIALFTAAAFAQNPDNPFERPPAGVDKALRDRINEFYHFHVTGEYRKAEGLVAEDTKDFFYSRNKPSYLSFEITKIQYSENFTRAKVTVLCEQYVMMPGFADKPLKVPTPSTWKLDDGKWYWYVDLNALRETPFGMMNPKQGGGGAGAPVKSLPAIPESAEAFLHLVRADRESVRLKPGGREQVTFTNTAPGDMTLSVVGEVAGIKPAFDRTALHMNDKAVLTIAAGENARSGLLMIRIEQTGETIGVQVEVQPGAEQVQPGVKAEAPLHLVKADKASVRLKPGGRQKVTFTSAAPGDMTLSVVGEIPGIKPAFDRTALKAGEKAVLTITALKKAKSGPLKVRVEQTGEIIAIQVLVR